MKSLGKKFNIFYEPEPSECINKVLEGDIDSKSFYDSLIKFEDLRAGGSRKHNIIDYIKAVEFCTYVVGGLSYTDSYKKTFPDRCRKNKEEWISRYATIYSNGELVSNIMQRIYMNQHILFIDKSISAKLKLYDMGMDDGVNDRERVNALDKFLVHTKKDEEKAGANINTMTINNNTINIVNAVDEKLAKLAGIAQEKIEDGTLNAKDVAESNIKFIEVEADK